MSEYKGIKGFQVQTRTDDPVPYAQALADNPYVGSWSSGGALNTARSAMGSAGDATNNLTISGETSTNVANVESYNGTAHTEIADVNTARRNTAGFGTSTAAYLMSGYTGSFPTDVESWNGSSWTETTEINTGRAGTVASGTTTAGLFAIGNDGGGKLGNTEIWNGSAWTEVNDTNTSRNNGASSGGTSGSTAALIFGGDTPAPARTGATELWNGSSWTEVNDLNTARFERPGGSGTSTSGLCYGGYTTAYVTNTESWDGTSWTEVNDMATGRGKPGSTPSSSNNTTALAAGGELSASPSKQSITEEWAFTGLDPSTTPAADYSNAIIGDFYYNSTTGQFKNITDGLASGSWSSGGAMNTGRDNMAGFGASNSAALVAGGGPGSRADTELYDGSSWTEVNNLNTAGTYRQNQFGIYTSGIVAGPPTAVESWDGTNWTEIAELNTQRGAGAGAGSSNASGVVFGGGSPSGSETEIWNGSSWTETGDLNTGRDLYGQGGGTTSTAAYGSWRCTKFRCQSESFNGSSWTEIADLNTARATRCSIN